MTLDISYHLMPEAQDDVAELIDDLITPVETELHLKSNGPESVHLITPK